MKNKSPSYSLGVKSPTKVNTLNKPTSFQLTNDIPGPGAYSATLQIKRTPPRWSISGRIKDRSRDEIPAPNAYSPTNVRPKTAPSWTMGARVVSTSEVNPTSPASYNAATSKNATLRSSPSASLKGRTYAKDPMQDIPGPGSYNAQVSKVRKSTPSYSLGGRVKVVTKSEAPGPGKFHTTVTSGVGAYNSPMKTTKASPAYSMGTKSPPKLNNDVPGPGSYQASTKTGKQKPSFSLSAKLPTKVSDYHNQLTVIVDYFSLTRARSIPAHN